MGGTHQEISPARRAPKKKVRKKKKAKGPQGGEGQKEDERQVVWAPIGHANGGVPLRGEGQKAPQNSSTHGVCRKKQNPRRKGAGKGAGEKRAYRV